MDLMTFARQRVAEFNEKVEDLENQIQNSLYKEKNLRTCLRADQRLLINKRNVILELIENSLGREFVRPLTAYELACENKRQQREYDERAKAEAYAQEALRA